LLVTIGYSKLTYVEDENQDLFELSIDGILDLHTFNPKDVRQLIPEYIEACLEKKIYSLRIIHGKGIGVLRETTHTILKKHPAVKSFHLDPEPGVSWGATLVELKIK
jgi:DNA-nicking Smr family endonuclease